ncbi:hypothetical protein RDABS01_006268 [Bienertia sinuspersici]
MNFDSVNHLVSSNGLGKLIKLDQRSILRNKIRFIRACISTDITSRLDSNATIRCSDGVTRGYFVWYEDLSEGCAFCGNDSHSIDNCPILQKPKSEFKITVKPTPPPPPPPNHHHHES